MKRYIFKRIFISLITLFTIITITFFLMHAVPGNPFSKEGKIPEAVMENLNKKYGLDKPLLTQYGIYLKNLSHLDLGDSMKSKTETVNDMIKRGFPVSLQIAMQSLLLALIIGPVLGSLAALYQNKFPDYLAMIIAILGVSVPSFILGTVMIQFVATYMTGFPVGGWGSFKQSIMPAIALGMLPLAYTARLMRSTMLEVLNQDYIKTAKSKGLTKAVVIIKHAMRNAILPIVSSLGTTVTNLLVGSFVIEKIFGIPGLGQFFVTSIYNRDYPLIMGTTIFYSFILVVMILVVDILYMFVDPRIDLSKGAE